MLFRIMWHGKYLVLKLLKFVALIKIDIFRIIKIKYIFILPRLKNVPAKVLIQSDGWFCLKSHTFFVSNLNIIKN